MGFFSAIGSFISSAVSFVGSCVSSIGKAVASMATSFLKGLGPMIEVVSGIIKMVAEYFGVLKPEDDIEELGAKAMKSDKKVEDFDSVSEYIDHLRNDIELEKNEMKKMGIDQKLACKAVGSAITSKALSEKVGIDIPVSFWIEVGKQSMTFKEAATLIETYKNSGTPIQLSEYLKGELKVKDSLKNGGIIDRKSVV